MKKQLWRRPRNNHNVTGDDQFHGHSHYSEEKCDVNLRIVPRVYLGRLHWQYMSSRNFGTELEKRIYENKLIEWASMINSKKIKIVQGKKCHHRRAIVLFGGRRREGFWGRDIQKVRSSCSLVNGPRWMSKYKHKN